MIPSLEPPAPWSWAIALPLGIGLAAWSLRVVRRSAFFSGVPLGILVLRLGGLGGFVVLFGFFLLGTALTRFGYSVKESRGVAERDGGRRGASHVAANGVTGLLLLFLRAVLQWTGCGGPAIPTDGANVLLSAAFVGSFAAAASDTASTEIGQLWGRRAVLLPALRRVPIGTPGAVSLEGSLGGLAGAGILAAIGGAVRLVDAPGVVAVALAGFLANLLESVAGSPGRRLLPHGWLNFANTLVGAALAALGVALLQGRR